MRLSRYKVFYAPEEFDRVWEKFKDICRCEGESPASKIRKWIREYVERHGSGNPQTRLDVLLEGKPLVPKPPPCEFAGGVSKELVYCRRITMWVTLNHCWRCFRRQRTPEKGVEK